jgi:uncharacterized lipoprotein YajG
VELLLWDPKVSLTIIGEASQGHLTGQWKAKRKTGMFEAVKQEP